MSTTTCNVRGKQSDGLIQKVGPMKATIPMSSLLRPLNSASLAVTGSTRLFSTMSPPMRLISPDHNSSGHRSPGAINCYKGTKKNSFTFIQMKVSIPCFIHFSFFFALLI